MDESFKDASATEAQRLKALQDSRDAAQASFEALRLAEAQVEAKAGAQRRVGMRIAWKTMQKALVKVKADLRR